LFALPQLLVVKRDIPVPILPDKVVNDFLRSHVPEQFVVGFVVSTGNDDDVIVIELSTPASGDDMMP